MPIRYLDEEPIADPALSPPSGRSRIRFLDPAPDDKKNYPTSRNLLEGAVDYGSGLARKAAQGVSFGFADEIEAAAAANLMPGDFQKNYQSELERIRGNIKSVSEAAPVLSGAVEIAGAIANPVSRIGKATSFLGKIAQNTGIGAAGGALYGAGVGENASERKTGAVIGGLAGGALGATGTALFEGLPKAYQLGKKIVQGSTADDAVLDAIAAKPDAAQQVLNSPSNSPLQLIDATKQTQALGRSVRRVGGEGEELIEDFVKNRSANETKRIADLVHKELTGKEYFSNLDELQNSYRAAADPLYEEAFAQPFKPNKNLGQLIGSSPTLKTSFKRAVNDVADRGLEAPQDFLDGVDTRTADYMKENLDRLIKAAEKNEDGRGVFELNKLKDKFLKIIDRDNPTYAKAREVASDYFSNIEAQKFGLNFNRYKPEQIAQTLEKYTPAQRESALIGLREAIETAASRAREQGSATSRFYEENLNKDRIAQFFQDPQSFDRFDKALKEELVATQTKNRVLSGSQTDYNLAQGERLEGLNFFRNPVAAIWNSLRDAIGDRVSGVNKKNAAEIAKILTQRERVADIIAKSQLREHEKSALIDFLRSQKISGPIAGKAAENSN